MLEYPSQPWQLRLAPGPHSAELVVAADQGQVEVGQLQWRGEFSSPRRFVQRRLILTFSSVFSDVAVLSIRARELLLSCQRYHLVAFWHGLPRILLVISANFSISSFDKTRSTIT